MGAKRWRAMAAAVAAVLLLSACGGDDEGADTADDAVEDDSANDTDATDDDGADDAGADDAESGDGAAEAELPAFTLAFPSVLGVSHLPLVAAVDDLRDEGYEIETPFLAESELSVEGVASGEFEMSHGTSQSTMLANQAGASMEWLIERVSNEWTLFARNNIESCEDLDGVRLAIHSEGAVSTAMVQAYIDNTCPGTEPEFLVIPGSENRAAALIADEIDASPVELADAINLQQVAGDRFSILAPFSKDLPDLITATVYARTDFIEAEPEAVQALIDATLAQNERVAGDPEYMAELIRTYMPDYDEEILEEVAEAYSDGVMFPVDGGLTEESVQFTIDFFTDAEVIEPGLEPSAIWNQSFAN